MSHPESAVHRAHRSNRGAKSQTLTQDTVARAASLGLYEIKRTFNNLRLASGILCAISAAPLLPAGQSRKIMASSEMCRNQGCQDELNNVKSITWIFRFILTQRNMFHIFPPAEPNQSRTQIRLKKTVDTLYQALTSWLWAFTMRLLGTCSRQSHQRLFMLERKKAAKAQATRRESKGPLSCGTPLTTMTMQLIMNSMYSKGFRKLFKLSALFSLGQWCGMDLCHFSWPKQM